MNERPLADGVYTIKTKVNTGHFLDAAGVPGSFKNSTNVQIWKSAGDDNDERFRVKYISDGWYRIYEQTSGLAFEVSNLGNTYLKNTTNAQLYAVNDSKGQLWKIRKNSDGTYFLINKVSGYYLDLENAALTDGSNVSQHTYNGSNAQRWVFKMDPKPAKPVVKASSNDKKVTITWNKCPAVNKHDKRTYNIRIYTKDNSSAPFGLNLFNTKTVEEKKGLTDTRYTFNAPDYGTYYVKVTAVNSNYENYTTTSDETEFVVFKTDNKLSLNAASINSVSNLEKKTMTIKWSAFKEANRYQFQYRNQGAKSWTTANITGKQQYVMKNLVANDCYDFRIRAVKDTDDGYIVSPWSAINRRYVAKTTVRNVKPLKNGIKVAWTKDTKATGYKITVATDAKMTKNAATYTVRDAKTSVLKITNLKGGKTYYVRVRSYKKVNNLNYFGELSNKLYTTTKK